jgi:hypothetical protein
MAHPFKASSIVNASSSGAGRGGAEKAGGVGVAVAKGMGVAVGVGAGVQAANARARSRMNGDIFFMSLSPCFIVSLFHVLIKKERETIIRAR